MWDMNDVRRFRRGSGEDKDGEEGCLGLWVLI